MNGLKKLLAGSLISVFAISIFVLFASTSNATTFPVFDHMNSSAQAEFIADMVDRTEKALRDDGKPDLALKTEQLFAPVEPGNKISPGLAELESNVASVRVVDLDGLKKDPKAQRVDVEDALFLTLKRNGIDLSSNAMNSVINAMASFHALTNAEFRAQSASEQRHIVRLFSNLAFPDYYFRDMVRTQKSSFLGLDDKGIHNLAEIMSTQFPTSGEQPGFRNIQAAVETENAKAPNDAVFPTLLIYVLDELEKGVDARNQDLVDRSVLLPDGRHAYVGDDGAFWIFPSDEGKEGAQYKLEANLQPLAKRLSQCMETGGITDGRRAQTVCLERVAGVHPPATAPAAPPPPAAAPSSPPASPPADDPFGSGGFITPPTSFNALLCVSADLANNSSWSNPEGGSKMDTFKYRVGTYIQSVAKPGWEYWIAPGQYERFDPATTSSGGQFVSSVSPDSGRFDEFDPKCPSGYAAFWVKVSH